MKRFIRYLLVTLLTLGSIGTIYYVYKLNVLEDKIFVLMSIIIGFIWLVFSYKLLSKRTRKIPRIIFSIISILLVVIYGIACRYTNSTIEYAKKITNINFETVNYSVLTLKNNDFNSLFDLKNEKIGFLNSDNNIEKSISTLEKKLDFKVSKYGEVGSLIGKLYENEISALVISDSYFTLFEETNVEFINDYKKVYSYSIKVKTKNDDVKTVDVTKEPFIVYISGTDSRSTVSATARSDVNIIAVINPKEKKVLLINTPRDYYVQLHGTSGIKDKLTHAGVYGIEMSKNTMQDLLDININYYVKVSFRTVVNLVDAIDGIEIDSDTDFTATSELTREKCHYTVGVQQLNGDCALRYARERKTYTTGDRHRGQNQQAVITSIIKKLSNPKYLIRYNRILDSINDTMETDLNYDEITSFVKFELTNLSKWTVESISLDGEGAMLPTYSMGSNLPLYVMIPNEDTINAAKEKINEYLSVN